jgi:hypothetical protein
MTDPAVTSLLSTRGGRALYQQFRFVLAANPERQMELLRRDIYRPSAADGSTSS